ncbi:MAG TPA: fumarate hydratase C-terminal domain-containing protein, partial [Ruminococcus sp.]|nr:fumarate hydratase C-terminal domain-containing protein [Ruminococcus sp.]
MSIRKLKVEELRAVAPSLKIGDKILLSGYVYTSRDAAHKRIKALMDSGEKLPY